MVAIAVLTATVICAALTGCAPGPGSGPDDGRTSTPDPPVGPAGFAIHDGWTLGNGGVQKMDAVSCDSEFGPWHVVASGDLAALGLTSLDASFDFTLDPSSGSGPLTGTESSVTTDGDSYVGGSTGTATLDGDLITLEYDYDVTWSSPNMIILPGQEKITGHNSHELHVIAATAEECP